MCSNDRAFVCVRTFILSRLREESKEDTEFNSVTLNFLSQNFRKFGSITRLNTLRAIIGSIDYVAHSKQLFRPRFSAPISLHQISSQQLYPLHYNNHLSPHKTISKLQYRDTAIPWSGHHFTLQMNAQKTIDNYTILKQLGAGAFATVYAAEESQTLTQVAVKAIAKSKIRSPVEFELIQREVALMRSIDHPLITSFFEVLDDPQYFYIIMELVPNGNLLDYINRRKGLKEDEAKRIFCQIVSVLDYLHSEKKIAHRDLKCENVLLDKHLNIRITDFGLSRTFDANNPFLQTTCGSPAYVAPEIIREKPYTSAADIWSLGVLLYAMVCGTLPFSGDSVSLMLQSILTDQPRIPTTLSPELRKLLKQLLTKDPHARISLAEIKNSPWVVSYGNSMMFDRQSASFKGLKVMIGEALDPMVASQIRMHGFRVAGLAEELASGAVNKRTALYKMLKRELTVDQIDSWQKQRREKTEGELYYGKLPFLDGVGKKLAQKLYHKAPTTVEVKPVASKFKPRTPYMRRPMSISPKPPVGAKPAYV